MSFDDTVPFVGALDVDGVVDRDGVAGIVFVFFGVEVGVAVRKYKDHHSHFDKHMKQVDVLGYKPDCTDDGRVEGKLLVVTTGEADFVFPDTVVGRSNVATTVARTTITNTFVLLRCIT